MLGYDLHQFDLSIDIFSDLFFLNTNSVTDRITTVGQVEATFFSIDKTGCEGQRAGRETEWRIESANWELSKKSLCLDVMKWTYEA